MNEEEALVSQLAGLFGSMNSDEAARVIHLALGRDRTFHTLKWLGKLYFTKPELTRIISFWGFYPKSS